MTRRRAPLGADGGQASVELALLLPLVALLLLAILQVGLLARDVVLVTHAAREAARAAAVDASPGAPLAAARSAGGLDPARLSVAVTGRGAPGSRVRVMVAYRAPTDVPLVGALIGDRTVRSAATMRVEGPRAARRLKAGPGPADAEPVQTRQPRASSANRPATWEDLRPGRRNRTSAG